MAEIRMTRWLVVSRYKEPNMEWLQQINRMEWNVFVDEKGGDEKLNHPGREASTYLQWIVDRYDRIAGDEMIFCQAAPFSHDPEFLSHVHDPKVMWFGEIHKSDPQGYPACSFCPMHSWADVFDLPKLEIYNFVAGAQYRVFDEQILARPLEFWQALLSLSKIKREHNMIAWTLERFWPLIFGIEL